MLNRLPSELQQSLILPVELAINTMLSHDPATQANLGRYQGKVLALSILAPATEQATTLYLRILDNELSFSLSEHMHFDACLTGSLPDFIALGLSSNKSDRLINSNIDLSGDSEFAIGVTGIIENLDIDWEALISPITGGLLAHQIGSGFRSIFSWGKAAFSTQSTAVKDYLETEAGHLASAEQVDRFANQVDDVKLAADRLAARIDLLQKKQSSEKET